MGFADFLATAGRGTIVGDVAQGFGGRTPRQAALSNFIDNELPKYAQAIQAETDESRIPQLGMQFMSAAAKAGLPAQGIEKLMEMLVKPAQEGLRTKQLGATYGQLEQELAPVSQPRPEGVEGPLNASGAFLERPGTPFGPQHAARLAGAHARAGVPMSPALSGLLQAPSVIQENTQQAANQEAQAGKHKTEQNIAIEAQNARRNLPKTPIGNTGMDLNMLGLATEGRALGPYATASIPDPLEAEKRSRLQAQTVQAGAAAGASNMQGQLAGARIEDLRTGGPTVTEAVTDPNKDITARRMDERAFAAAVVDRGIDKMTEQEQAVALPKLAAEMGYTLTGTPKIVPPTPAMEPGMIFGNKWPSAKKNPKTGEAIIDPARLTGSDFSFTPNPQMKTISRQKGGVAPGGRQPAPAQGGAAAAMAAMPPASQHKGRTIRDTETGISYVSDGSKWIPR